MVSTSHLYALIMAGGGGTRLWPLSRRTHPKQMVKLFGERSMFQWAVARLQPLLTPEQILVVTAADQVEPLAAQAPELPRENFIVEPMGRGTAPCIGLGAIHLHRRDPEAVMAVLTADHYIGREAAFRQLLADAAQVAAAGYLVTLGIEPTYPATGYGYIRQGAQLAVDSGTPVFQVERFTEKPNAETAQKFLFDGHYAWNSGMFIWKTSRILEEFASLMPDVSATLGELAAALGTPEYESRLQQSWPAVRKETIDYGIMEKAQQVAVIPAELGWSDVGSWDSAMALLPAGEGENVSVGEHLAIDTKGTFVFSAADRLVATVGIENLMVVDTPDALLILPRGQSERVKEIVQRLETEGPRNRL